jgi:SAM-dependent methyltransferase
VATEVVLPPGTILQRLYVRERLRRRRPGAFVEIGVGGGVLTRMLLDLGWTGTGWDLNEDTLAAAARTNAAAVEDARLELRCGDWLDSGDDRQTDLVLSSMVLEHLREDEVARYFERAAEALRPGGIAVTLVPASPAHWGIEDEVAGHLRRYTRTALRDTLERAGWRVLHLVGLTYPVSNVLLALSNRQVARWEAGRVELDRRERTALTGVRDVPWKTRFPGVARVVLNDTILYPLHLLQRRTAGAESALVLYCEAEPRSR